MEKNRFDTNYRKLIIEDIAPGKSIVFARDMSSFANDHRDEIDMFGPYTFIEPTIVDGRAYYEKAGQKYSCSVKDILKGQSSDGIFYRCPC